MCDEPSLRRCRRVTTLLPPPLRGMRAAPSHRHRHCTPLRTPARRADASVVSVRRIESSAIRTPLLSPPPMALLMPLLPRVL